MGRHMRDKEFIGWEICSFAYVMSDMGMDENRNYTQKRSYNVTCSLDGYDKDTPSVKCTRNWVCVKALKIPKG